MNAHALRLILFTTASNLKRSQMKLSRCHRCPPCKTFSPKLIEFYNSCKDELEVVFISSDKDEKSFSGYFGKFPWLATVPAYSSTENSDRQQRLATMFKIQVGGVSLWNKSHDRCEFTHLFFYYFVNIFFSKGHPISSCPRC